MPEAEDIHHFVELELVQRIGDLGLKLHTGRSRNEQIATDLRLYIRAASKSARSRQSAAIGPTRSSLRPRQRETP